MPATAGPSSRCGPRTARRSCCTSRSALHRSACATATTRRSAVARTRSCTGSISTPGALPATGHSPPGAPSAKPLPLRPLAAAHPPMSESDLTAAIERRRTFAIISHPDAGKTTLTEKLLLFGGAIQMAGTVKGRKAARHATSDWMRLEQQRGISVTSSVMQFPYGDCIVNLLDTPGHEDFSEDTYRTLTAVDSALMVIDCAKGVEERTIKLMDVCRLRDTPITTFINKLDREGRPPIELLDEIEQVLKIRTAPVTWPIGMGRELRGIYHLIEDRIYVYTAGERGRLGEHSTIEGLASPAADAFLGSEAQALRAELELVKGATEGFDAD